MICFFGCFIKGITASDGELIPRIVEQSYVVKKLRNSIGLKVQWADEVRERIPVIVELVTPHRDNNSSSLPGATCEGKSFDHFVPQSCTAHVSHRGPKNAVSPKKTMINCSESRNADHLMWLRQKYQAYAPGKIPQRLTKGFAKA